MLKLRPIRVVGRWEDRTETKRLLLCLLEAFEHVDDLILLVQTKFSSRQSVDQRLGLVEGILEIVCLCEGWRSARRVANTISVGRTDCNNACLACGDNSLPELLSSSTTTSFWRRMLKEDVGRSFDITTVDKKTIDEWGQSLKAK